MTTITLNTESLFKDILAAFDTMNRETPLNRFLVDLGRHQTLVLKEMIEGQLPHLMVEQSKEVKKLEEQNEKMLAAFRVLLQDMDNVDRVCDLAGVHPFTGMRSVIQSFVNEGEQE
jgi:hypothetical protein